MNRSAFHPARWGFADGVVPYVGTVRHPRINSIPHAGEQRPGKHIAYWLGRLHYVPSVEEIVTRWSVSRATAYRWHAFAVSKCADQPT